MIGNAVSICAAAAAVWVFWVFWTTKMIPFRYLALAGGILAVLTALVVWLTRRGHGVIRYALGMFLGILLTACFLAGGWYGRKTLKIADKITGGNVESAQIGIYVRNGSEDDFRENAVSYQYGILKDLDRVNTDAAIAQYEKQLNAELSVREYGNLPLLVDALLDQETDAVILNAAYLDILEEMEGYETVREQMKEVLITSVESTVRETSGKETGASVSTDGETTFLVYISGIDSRLGELTAKSRSDVNILAAVNANTRQIALVSTPRDYYVPLSISNGVPDKLTHAGIYGVQVSMDTLGMLYGVQPDAYFRVNFSGFEQIVDALGGITVISDYTFDTENAKGYHFVKGENVMDGEAALAFCRERYAFASGDNQRGKNQMAVIRGILQKCFSTELLKNYTEVLEAAGDSFETSISYDVISALVRKQLEDPSGWNIVSYSAVGTGDRQVPYSMSQSVYVMVPDLSSVETGSALLQDVLEGKIITEP